LEGNDQEATISAEFNESAIVASVDKEKGGKRRKYMFVSVHSTTKKSNGPLF
jgi:hypothetical protein